jgi:hypothetical protein
MAGCHDQGGEKRGVIRPWYADYPTTPDEEAYLMAVRDHIAAVLEQDTEYLRLIALGQSSYVAQRQSGVDYGAKVELAKAYVDIMRSRLGGLTS